MRKNKVMHKIKNRVLRPLGLKKRQSELYAVIKSNFN